MNLKICAECNKIINVDNLEDADPTSIIGCGLKENGFAPCSECGHKYDSVICKALRKEDGWTKTTAKEYYEAELL